MTKNPLYNALAAAAYIIIIATVMQIGSSIAGPQTGVLMPIAVLSVFTLSAAVMGYLFLGEPIQMFLSGEKKKAVTLFLQTVGVFAVITAVVLVLTFSRIV